MEDMILTPKQLRLSREPVGNFRDSLEFRKIVFNICNEQNFGCVVWQHSG